MQNILVPNSNKSVAHPPVRGIERGPYLIVATPVLNVLADLEAKLKDALVEDPQAGRTHTLQRVVSQLRDALTRAEETESWATIADIHERIDRPTSTITEWAQKYGDQVWCSKQSGIWSVDMQKFDAWYRLHKEALDKRKHPPRSRKAKRATDAGVADSSAGHNSTKDGA